MNVSAADDLSVFFVCSFICDKLGRMDSDVYRNNTVLSSPFVKSNAIAI